MAENYEAAVEIREAINELTKELREVRVALNAITELFEEVIDKGAGQYPGFVRTQEQQ